MATKNIVPRADGEGNIGTSLKNWLKGWFKDLFVSGIITDGTDDVTVNEIRTHIDAPPVGGLDDLEDVELQSGISDGDILQFDSGLGFWINKPALSGNFQKAESLTVSSHVSTVFLNKIDFTTTVLPIGTYVIYWSYGWNHDSTLNDFVARLALDNDFSINNLLMYHRQEPKDSLGIGSGKYVITGTNQAYRASGFMPLNFVSEASHNFKLDFASTVFGVDSSMWDAIIALWRVG